MVGLCHIMTNWVSIVHIVALSFRIINYIGIFSCLKKICPSLLNPFIYKTPGIVNGDLGIGQNIPDINLYISFFVQGNKTFSRVPPSGPQFLLLYPLLPQRRGPGGSKISTRLLLFLPGWPLHLLNLGRPSGPGSFFQSGRMRFY